MIGQVAHILAVFEGDGEGQSVKGRFPSALCWTKVVSVETTEEKITLCVEFLLVVMLYQHRK